MSRLIRLHEETLAALLKLAPTPQDAIVKLLDWHDTSRDVMGESLVAAVDSALEDASASEEPAGCECDNTHKQNDTVCRWCWNRGRRHWEDAEVAAVR